MCSYHQIVPATYRKPRYLPSCRQSSTMPNCMNVSYSPRCQAVSACTSFHCSLSSARPCGRSKERGSSDADVCILTVLYLLCVHTNRRLPATVRRTTLYDNKVVSRLAGLPIYIGVRRRAEDCFLAEFRLRVPQSTGGKMRSLRAAPFLAAG